MKRLALMVSLGLFVAVATAGCASTGGVLKTQMHDARQMASQNTVSFDRQAVAISLDDIPVYIDRGNLSTWLSQSRSSYDSADDGNSVDYLYAVARELLNQTQGLRVFIPAGAGVGSADGDLGRRSSRRRTFYDGRTTASAKNRMPSYDDIRLADGRVPFWFGVVASEALRRNDAGYRRNRRDPRDGGSAWVTVTVELRAPVDGGWVVVASGTGGQGWRKFLVVPLRVWGVPYDPVYESTGRVMTNAYGDMIESLDLAPWAEVWRNQR